MRILIVEDEPMLRHRFDEELSSAGHTIVGTAVSTGEAFILGQAAEPHLAVIDLDMSEHATEVTQLAHALSDTLDMSVILVRSESSCSDCAPNRTVGVLLKPLEIGELARAVDAARNSAY